jgi:23S rRNA (adenine1618-N6)-methyltransferase
MQQPKKEHPKEKTRLHPRNRHRERYDFKQLIAACPELAPYVTLNIYGDESVDFFNPVAVKMLNKALLKQYYDLDFWDIPEHYLCPPIPGRADYIHYMADLLANCNHGAIPTGPKINCLDVGVVPIVFILLLEIKNMVGHSLEQILILPPLHRQKISLKRIQG